VKGLREFLSDAVIAAGSAIVVFSAVLVILILVTAVPVANPYIGLFVFIILPALVVAGLGLFVFGGPFGHGRRGLSIKPTLNRLQPLPPALDREIAFQPSPNLLAAARKPASEPSRVRSSTQ